MPHPCCYMHVHQWMECILGASGFMSNRGRQNVASFLALDMGLEAWPCCDRAETDVTILLHFFEFLDLDLPCTREMLWIKSGSHPKPSTQTTDVQCLWFSTNQKVSLWFSTKNTSGLAPRCWLVWEFSGGLWCGLELGFLAFTISICMHLDVDSTIATWTAQFNEMVEVPTVRLCQMLRELDPCCGADHWQSKSLQRILDWCLLTRITLVYWLCPVLFPAQNNWWTLDCRFHGPFCDGDVISTKLSGLSPEMAISCSRAAL